MNKNNAECSARDGEIYESEDDIPEIPVHPNCRCSITEDEIYPAGNTVSSRPYTVKKKEIITMDKVLTKDLKDALKQHEGIKPNLYLDSKGILTVGIGNNVSRKSDFVVLNLVDAKDGHTLSMAEKENLYTQIMSEVREGAFYEKNYSQYQVPLSEIENKFNAQLEQSYHELERKFPDFQTFPVPVQQALLDMQFNMGNAAFQGTSHVAGGRIYSGWPKLFNAIKNRDWRTAAEQSHRKDIQPSRNMWTRDLFLQGLI